MDALGVERKHIAENAGLSEASMSRIILGKYRPPLLQAVKIGMALERARTSRHGTQR